MEETVRNLDQLQEEDPRARMPRGVGLTLLALGGACVVFTAIVLGGRKSAPKVTVADPLGELVAQRSHASSSPSASAKAPELAPSDVTFPGILSDKPNPPTALAAVRGGPPAAAATANDAQLQVGAFDPSSPTAPPAPSDRLPVVPLPARHVLQATPVVTRPRDALTRAAAETGQVNTPSAPSAPSGSAGGYQLQISSFRTAAEAQAFAAQLRARGHKSYVAEAQVPGRGTWYRVRVGPFPSQAAAAAYRSGFESKEHVVPFIVPPQGR